MEKWKSLGLPQKALLVILALSTLVFSVLYALIGRQTGIQYGDGFLRFSQTEDGKTYSGRAKGQDLVFTVAPDQSVTCRWGDVTHGPYTVIYDDTAVPRGSQLTGVLTGVEVWEGNTRLFRGGWAGERFSVLVAEDGGPVHDSFHVSAGAAPSVGIILRLSAGPALVSRGAVEFYLVGLFVAAAAVVSVLFADALFRWDLRFRIRDPEGAEPSEWELLGRTIGQIALTIVTIVCFAFSLSGLS